MFLFQGILLCCILSSVDITRLHQYYDAIRLPVIHLAFSSFDSSAILFEKRQGLPSSCKVTMYSMPRSTPRSVVTSLPFTLITMLFSVRHKHQPVPIVNFEAQFSSAYAFGLLPFLPTLKPNVTVSAPRLDTEWLARPSQTGFPPAILYTLLGALGANFVEFRT